MVPTVPSSTGERAWRPHSKPSTPVGWLPPRSVISSRRDVTCETSPSSMPTGRPGGCASFSPAPDWPWSWRSSLGQSRSSSGAVPTKPQREAIVERGLADDAAIEAIAEASTRGRGSTIGLDRRTRRADRGLGRPCRVDSLRTAGQRRRCWRSRRSGWTTRPPLVRRCSRPSPTSHGFLDAHTVDQSTAQPGVVMPDGETAFIGGDDGRIRPYDLESGAVGEPLPALSDDVGSYSLLRRVPGRPVPRAGRGHGWRPRCDRRHLRPRDGLARVRSRALRANERQ